jgi:hypothetical protein
MRMVTRDIGRPRSFERGPVLDYWLGRCQGFEVTSAAGHGKGTVEAVILDDAGRASALVVRGALIGRRHVIAADSVAAVAPGGEALALAPEPSRSGPGGGGRRRRGDRPMLPRARLALGAVGRGALLALSALLVATATAFRSIVSALRRHTPVVAAHTVAAARTGSTWARPRIAAGARLASAALVSALLLLFAVAQGIAIAARAYWALVAREASRLRAARS